MVFDIEVSLYLYDNGNGEYIKMLIDENRIVYHYTDHVALGILDEKTGSVDFYYETQEEYDEARKKKNFVLRRLFH